jgi:four helix bundle protein
MNTENRILDLSFDFSLSVIELYKSLVNQKEFFISKQLLKSATSIGANVEEANAAFSKKEFIAKMSIASKEARETRYWLRLLDRSNLVELNYVTYLESIEQIIRILTNTDWISVMDQFYWPKQLSHRYYTGNFLV